jgi:hypothetical protein
MYAYLVKSSFQNVSQGQCMIMSQWKANLWSPKLEMGKFKFPVDLLTSFP